MIALIVIALIAAVIGFGTTIYFYQSYKQIQRQIKDKKFQEISEEEAINKASQRAKTILIEAKHDALKVKTKSEKRIKQMYDELEEEEKRLEQREQKLNQRIRTVENQREQLDQKVRSVDQAKKHVHALRVKLSDKLEKIAGMSKNEARDLLLKNLDEELHKDMAKKIKEAENEAQRESEEKAKWILVDSMQKAATDYVAETTTTTIELDKEDLKGKIIGKEGRNIRTFEKLTGVDIIVDEAPEAVTLSSFDPVRREVAAIALKKLLKDGRVHPGTIESSIQKVKEDIAREIRKTGEKLSYEAGFTDLPQEVIRFLGRFKYRYSYGQNLIKHTLEMIKLGSELAIELGADINLVKKACLLHDIGKVLVHEVEGKPHHVISGDVVRKYLNDEKLANAVEAHHGDIEAKSIEAVIVAIADAISGARPGARRTNYEDYIKRIRALEDIANKHKGVKEAYAIHAGREVRVILKPEATNDEDARVLAHKISKEIEKTQQYPGTVKVTVIRELRHEEEAK